ncbi:MAG: EAL domain-containing protein [Alphaproteobacteria bacterium]|nr:EAL domain-containing protein [Alphaproteobacteria bacterium]
MSNDNLKRILIIDDNPSIHTDFRKILESVGHNDAFDEDEALLFNKTAESDIGVKLNYHIDSAYQGKEALELVQKSVKTNEPYSLAFVDILMPPGWNGIETIKEMWKVDRNIQIVICSAHSDYSWEDIQNELGTSEDFLILKKPFEVIEICQLATALTQKWDLKKQVQYQIDNLQHLVKERTRDLELSLSLVHATIESTSEGILVVSHDQKIVLYNQKYLDLWSIPKWMIESSDSALIFKKMAEQMIDSTIFLQTMSELSKHNDIVNFKELMLKSNKSLEFYRHPQYLNNEIVGTVCSFRDVTGHKVLEEQLLYQATHDSLTDLTNRVLLYDRVQQATEHAKRYGMFVGFIIFDLDNFKHVNDSYGHNVGDTLLIEVSKRLTSNVRKVDTVTRLGGDEFVVLFAPQPNLEDIEQTVEKLFSIFAAPYNIMSHELTATVSMGVSVYPRDGEDYNTLLKQADIALYRSKELGRNNFQFFQPEFCENAIQNAQLSADLHTALEKNELFLNYQPLVDLKTTKMIGAEALIRWEHPTLGLIEPSVIISLAEKNGLIIPIGNWVLQTACAQNKIWQEIYGSELRIAVNISGHQFQQKNFVETIRNVLQTTGLKPSSLELELTEGIVIAHTAEFIEKMTELKKLGVQLSLDDFGTGYSNLGYLKYFPFDKVKIDKVFIDEITSGRNDDCIVEAIISMSKKMGLTVLAEGVEKDEQVKYLLKNHSDQVQGYYFSKPLNANDCTEFLKNSASKEEIEIKIAS